MLTGSMASNYWGVPRTTHDLDFVVALEKSATDTFAAAFQGDFFLQTEAIRSAFAPPYQFNALDQRSALKVDFWVLQAEPFAQAMFARRMHSQLFGEPAWLATAEDVILHKLAWHRLSPSERQLHDVAGVFAVQGTALDQTYLQTWAGPLGVENLLQDLREGRLLPKTT
jgi:hypothetical protein